MKKTTTLAGLIALALAQPTFAETQLNPIVVSAQNIEQNIADTTSNLHVITREEIDLKQYQTLPQALQSVPGLSISHTGGMGKQTSLYMRGSKKVLILLDGIPLNDPSNENFALPETILLDDIERVEILKGGQSGIWGANAAAGVINLITRSAQDKPSGSASFAVGSDALTHLAANLSARNDKAYFAVNLSEITTDGYSAIRHIDKSPRSAEKDGYSQSNYSFKLGITPTSSQTLEFFTKQSQMDADYDSQFGFPSMPNDEASKRSVTTKIYQVSHQAKLDKFQVRTWLNQTRIERDEDINSSFIAVMNAERTELGTQASFQYTDKGQIQAFAQINKSEIASYDLKIKNKAFGLNNSNRFGQLVLNQSLRYDNYNEFDNKTTGKLGAAYEFTTDVRLAVNAGASYTAPSIDQIVNPWGAVNPNLKPEDTKYWDLTLDLYGLSLTYFESQVKNEFFWNDNGTTSDFSDDFNDNSPEKTKHKGVEVSYFRDITPLNTQLNLSYSYLNAKDAEGKRLEKRSKDTASVDITYYGLDRTKINWQTNYIGSTLDYRTPTTKQIGKYSTSDLSVDYQVNKHFNINAKVSNVFDKDYTHAYTSNPEYVYSTSGRIWQVRVKGSF